MLTNSPVLATQEMSNRIRRSLMLSTGGSLAVIVSTVTTRPMRSEIKSESAILDASEFRVKTALVTITSRLHGSTGSWWLV